MKVVLFCGGQGMRLRDYSETIPKPMVNVGYRPILWNVMKYYAHFGHKDFVLCLGHKGDVIKNYFMNYAEYLSNDFTLSDGGKNIHLYNSDIKDWKITFVDTGLTSNIGQRLLAAKPYLEGEEIFLANYSDGLTDLDLPTEIDFFERSQKIGCFLSVRPNQSFHIVDMQENGMVNSIRGFDRADLWMNGGGFIFNQEIFDFMEPGEELVMNPFKRLIEKKQLISYKYEGFWQSMDTFKDKQHLDEMHASGNTPWEVWKEKSAQG